MTNTIVIGWPTPVSHIYCLVQNLQCSLITDPFEEVGPEPPHLLVRTRVILYCMSFIKWMVNYCAWYAIWTRRVANWLLLRLKKYWAMSENVHPSTRVVRNKS